MRQRARNKLVVLKFVLPCLAMLFLAGCMGLMRSAGTGTTSSNSASNPASGVFGFDIRNPLVSWPKEPFTWWRLWDAGVDWSRVEPQQNQYNFQLMDQYVTLAQDHGVKILYVASNTPLWAAADQSITGTPGTQGGNSPPRDMNDWANFITTFATRYKGKIAAYEIWNEADLPGYWTGTVPQMVQICQIAHDIIKKIDPAATVLAPSVVAGQGLTFLPQFWAAGGANSSDAVAYHMYDTQMVPELSIPFFHSMINAAAGGGKQLWNTEIGWGPWGTWPSEQAAANFVARDLIIQRSLGVPIIIWYAWDDRGPWVNLYMVESDLQTPTLAATAYRTVTSWLDDAGVSCSNLSEQWQCTVSGSGTQYIVWSTSGSGSFSIPSTWNVKTMVDLAGNSHSITGGSISLSGAPVLLK